MLRKEEASQHHRLATRRRLSEQSGEFAEQVPPRSERTLSNGTEAQFKKSIWVLQDEIGVYNCIYVMLNSSMLGGGINSSTSDSDRQTPVMLVDIPERPPLSCFAFVGALQQMSIYQSCLDTSHLGDLKENNNHQNRSSRCGQINVY